MNNRHLKLKYKIELGLIVTLFLVLTFFNIKYTFIVVSGSSMFPTLRDGCVCLATKSFDIQIGDVFLLEEPNENKLVIKRLVGIPGDTLKFIAGNLYRNGDYLLTTEDIYYREDVSLKDDEYYFIGDNFEISNDSRYWNNFVSRDKIYFKLKYILYPFTYFRKVEGL